MARLVIALALVLPSLLPGAALAQRSVVAPTMELPGKQPPPDQPAGKAAPAAPSR